MSLSSSSSGHVSVVLLCMGRGGDPTSFRPSRDESQYWCRRDALVRCVTAFLFGPRVSPSDNNGNVSDIQQKCSRDMILIFDDDRARVHLTLDTESTGKTFVPTEQAILSLFKEAAQSLNKTVTHHGLACRTIMDPAHSSILNSQKGSNNELPVGLQSKREVLECLQKTCSIDFLRSRGLNSNITVLLRKSNKKDLVEVWKKWRQQQQQQPGNSNKPPASQSKGLSDPTIIESLFHDVIHSFQDHPNCDTIVGTLHESCEEFPCFGLSPPTRTDSVKTPHHDETRKSFRRIVLFLGAVRDMSIQENQILDKVCHTLNVPRVGMRFATVPEFTSKILSVLAFHQSHPYFWRGALQRLLLDHNSSRNGKTLKSSSSTSSRGKSTCLHVICHVPIPSTALSAELTDRDRIHWSLVRVVVCTLWRSRLASADHTADHVNTLTLIFEDGISLFLEEGSFVSKLASQHQAAPSEYQILTAVRQLLNAEPSSTVSDDWSTKKVASTILDKILSSSNQPVTSTISINPLQHSSENDISISFYEKMDDEVRSSRAAILVLDLSKDLPDDKGGKRIGKMHRAVLTAAAKRNLPTISFVGSGNAIDYEASSIICVQHFLYQNRLFVDRGIATHLGKKRKATC